MKRNLLMACTSAILVVATTTVVMAQSGDSPGRRGRGSDSWRGGRDAGPAGLLMNENVRKELEIVDDQLEELKAIGEEMRSEMREAWSGMRDLSREERRERMGEMRSKMQEMRAKTNDRVNEVLLPNQLARLKQITLQSQMRSRGTAGALGNSDVAEALGLTDDQQARLREKAEIVQRELQEKVEKLRKEAREELMGVLTTEQRAKLKELLGEQFDLGRGGGRGFGDRRDGGGRGR